MALDTAIPATLSAAHVALATWRRHRAQPRGILSSSVLPSFLFIATPWIWPSTSALIVAAGAHVVWLVICEWLAPPRASVAVQRSVSVPEGTTRLGQSPPAPRGRPSGSTPTFAATGVLAVIDETAEIRLFRLARPEGLQFAAGQFIPVRLSIDERPHVRCYSICSSPATTGYFEIAVRRQGLVSSTLHSILRPGSPVTVGQPAGVFTYPAGDDRPIALLAGGVGITPLLSMLRHGIASDPLRSIAVLYSVRSEHEVAFSNELRLIAERHPHVRIGLTVTRPHGQGLHRKGRIDMEMINTFVPEPKHTIFLICGPGEMIAGLSSLLGSMGVPPGQIRSERFELAVAAGSLQPTRVAATARPSEPGERRIEFAASRRSVVAKAHSSLLELAEEAGVPIAFSCRSGVCQSCRTRLLRGEADCRSEMMDAADREDGFILPCVSWPLTDCVLDV